MPIAVPFHHPKSLCYALHLSTPCLHTYSGDTIIITSVQGTEQRIDHIASLRQQDFFFF